MNLDRIISFQIKTKELATGRVDWWKQPSTSKPEESSTSFKMIETGNKKKGGEYDKRTAIH